MVWGSKFDHASEDRGAEKLPEEFKQHLEWFIDNLTNVEYHWYNKTDIYNNLFSHLVSLASRTRNEQAAGSSSDSDGD